MPSNSGLSALKRVLSGQKKLFSGALAAKVVGMASIPLLARLFGPADFAALAVFSSILVLASPFLTLKFSQALPLIRSERTAATLFAVCISMTLVVAVVAPLLVLGAFEAGLLRSPDPTIGFVAMLAVALLMLGVHETAVSWLMRAGSYGTIAKIGVVQALVGIAAKAAFGFAGFGSGGLLAGHVVQQSGGALVAARVLQSVLGRGRSLAVRARAVIHRYRAQPLLRLPSQIVLAITTQILVLYFANQYELETTGQLGMAMGAIAAPVALLSQTASQAFYSEAAKLGKRNREQIRRLGMSIVWRMALVGLGPVLLLFSFGEPIFRVVLGENWGVAGRYCEILAPVVFFQLISAPLTGAYTVVERLELLLRVNLVRLALVFTLLLVTFMQEATPEQTLSVYSAVISGHYFIFMVSTFQLLGRKP